MPINDDFDVDLHLPEEDSLVIGVNAVAHAAEHIAGVRGFNRKSGPGVTGSSREGTGVQGFGLSTGVFGENKTGQGVVGAGVWGNSTGGGFGVAGTSDAPGGAGVFGRGARAAVFEGDVEVTGDIRLTGPGSSDCAEDFDIADAPFVEPGTVMVLGEAGMLHQSHQAYDKRVAGVISGAGDYKPGIVLDKQHSQPNRKPISLLGKVYCKVDASYVPVEVGDLLTTSPTPGHAMKAEDPLKAFGAVIGKALRPLGKGQGLIPILIALQ